MDVRRARAASKAAPSHSHSQSQSRPLPSRQSSSTASTSSVSTLASSGGTARSLSPSRMRVGTAMDSDRGHSCSVLQDPTAPPVTPRRSSLFGSWRGSRKQDLAALEGKELRDAVWREQQQQAARRGPRVIRFDPSGDTRDGDGDVLEDDGASTSTAESSHAAATTPRRAHDLDGDAHAHGYGHAPAPAANDRRPSCTGEPSRSSLSLSLSQTLGRLSLRGGDSVIADYKAKKYDVDWKRDHDCPDCQLCRLPFTKLSRRRHHCRICGDVVCAECSPDQVHCVDRFARPKRACATCVALLEAMMHLGDRRVQLFCQRATPGARDWARAEPAALAALPPTQYHDRVTEIQRVAAAGKKARRAGSLGRRCVISAAWLRAWLAFTRADDDAAAATGGDPGAAPWGGRFRALSCASSSWDGRGAPPGPIDNLALLEPRQGVLRARQGLVQGRGHGHGGEYQVISLDVWLVLHRLYGGGPLIEVVPSDRPGAPDDWIVDVGAVLRRARALCQAVESAASVTPSSSSAAPRVPLATTLTVADKLVERALVERHDPFHILLDVLDGAFSSSSSGSDSLSPLSTAVGEAHAPVAPPPPPSSSSSSSSFGAGESAAEATGKSRRVVKQSEPERERDREGEQERGAEVPSNQATRLPPKEPSRDQSAAQAASAFALAMKQARLKSQKAIIKPREQQL
ncbi:hypothetical protein P43SY_003855 [Pythium insidiosum]|uniref:FYVE-type domain-containing protein n=1 Tax=Pythium insidiosum TaxID=114742 RepID=A0AAD5Q8D3_PYTIN|nr:hypothetical protein P43SY_003855 [Pythium insidiosum]